MARILGWFVVLSIAACGGSASQVTGASGTAGIVASGTTGGTGNGATSTGSSSGGSSTGKPDAGACDGTRTEFLACNDAATDCDCGQFCLNDPLFAALIAADSAAGVCETQCTGDRDCLNAATICVPQARGGSACLPNLCDGGIGRPCTANPGPGTDAAGTCVIQSEQMVSLCMPNGSATTCDGNDQVGNDDPQAVAGQFTVLPQSVDDPALFCGAGQACFGSDPRSGGRQDVCAQLCSTTDSSCPDGGVCLSQDAKDRSWGFCEACLTGQAACNIDSDCCTGECGPSQSCCVVGLPGDRCNSDSDCCVLCVNGFCA